MPMYKTGELGFNPAPSSVMHIDLNSCFATIEQQANPHLRFRPIAVAAYDSLGGCILAPSIEAKTFGVKTGMRVKEGKKLCPQLVVLTPDPAKYRFVHLELRKILKKYTNDFAPKSIDEFVLNLTGYPAFDKGLAETGKEIKKRITAEVGDWLRVSIGIGTNRFLAKTAAGLKKPDGLDEINVGNYEEIYRKLELRDLNGISYKNEDRLKSVGINSVLDFYHAPLYGVRAAFKSVNAYYWHLRLRGWEIDDVEFERRSFGNSFALPHSNGAKEELLPILQKLCEKTGSRMRNQDYVARGIHVSLLFRDHSFWHKGVSFGKMLFDSRDIYKKASGILDLCPQIKPVHVLAVSCFNLSTETFLQPELFENTEKKRSLTHALDSINNRWGDFVATPARMVLASDLVKDRIAFGGVKEL